MPTRTAALRRRVHEVLEVARPSDVTSFAVDVLLIVLIAANVLVVILESVASFRRVHGPWLDTFEIFSVLVFSLEYGLRLWSCVESRCEGESGWRARARYLFSPMALTDLAAILPFYLSTFFAVDLRFLRVLRLLRVFKFTRYSSAMRTVIDVLAAERRALGASLFVMGVVTIVAASGIHLAEHVAQPEAFDSIPASLWWAVVTLTSVGYGDVTPVTPMGRVFAGVISVVGVGLVALPAGLLASGFSEAHRRRREQLAREMDEALEDGVVSAEEAEAYDELADRLGVSPELAHEIAASVRRQRPLPEGVTSCPHCGKALT